MIVEGSHFSPPAPADHLVLLRRILPRETPSDYFAFMERMDGGQVWFDADDPAGFNCIRIYSVSRMRELQASLHSLFPSLVVIGGDQGAQYLGYDTEAPAPWPLVMFLPGSGAIQIAASFTELARRYFRNVGERVGNEDSLA